MSLTACNDLMLAGATKPVQVVRVPFLLAPRHGARFDHTSKHYVWIDELPAGATRRT
jgi:hypothetical protein